MAQSALPSLPIELIPTILQSLAFLYDELARIALTCRAFHQAAMPLLYAYVRIRDTSLVSKILRTLARAPDLAAHVRTLELRVWPFGSHDAHKLHDLACQSLQNCHKLTSLIWTRKNALTKPIMQSLGRCVLLQKLEVNGALGGLLAWDPEEDLYFLPSKLRSLSFIMPDRYLCTRLHHALRAFPRLQELKLLGYADSAMGDGTLRQLGHLGLDIESFSISGASRITESALADFIAAQPRLRHLAVENLTLSPTFSPIARVPLLGLESIAMTYPSSSNDHPDAIFAVLRDMGQLCPRLCSITLTNGTQIGRQEKAYPVLSSTEYHDLLYPVGPRLTYLELRGLVLSREGLEHLCRTAPILQDAILHVEWSDFTTAVPAFKRLHHLETLHLLCAQSDIEQAQVDALLPDVATSAMWRVGVRNRLWAVEWEGGVARLGPYKLPFWPNFGPY